MEENIKDKRGILIVFEGIDGSGKSTQAEISYKRLTGFNIPVRLLREPTNGKYGRMIRHILAGQTPRRSPQEELDLFVKDREENVAKNILPALHHNEVVLLDRYYYSTIAYQGALGLDVKAIRAINESFAPRPDLVLIFLIPVEKGLARIRAVRKNGTDHYEKEAFLTAVDKIFRSFKDQQIRYIDGERPLNEVRQDVQSIIDHLLTANGYEIPI